MKVNFCALRKNISSRRELLVSTAGIWPCVQLAEAERRTARVDEGRIEVNLAEQRRRISGSEIIGQCCYPTTVLGMGSHLPPPYLNTHRPSWDEF